MRAVAAPRQAPRLPEGRIVWGSAASRCNRRRSSTSVPAGDPTAPRQRAKQPGTAFTEAAFADGARVVYLAAGRRPAQALAELAASGLEDVAARVSSGQLEVRAAEDAYLTSSRFEPGEMIDGLRADVEAATARGWSGVRIAGEMEWAPVAGCDAASVVQYEAAVDSLFRFQRVAALCMYDRRRFDRAACDHVASVHQLVLAAVDGSSLAWPLCGIERGREGTIRLVGEVDFSNARSVIASLRLEAERRDEVRLDLSALGFADVYAFGRLAELERDLRRMGRRLTVTSASPEVERMGELLGEPCPGSLAGEQT